MRNPFAATAVTLFVVGLVFVAPRPAAGDTALDTSTWSVEIGTDVGSGDTDGSFAIRCHSGASTAFRLGVELDLVSSEGDGKITSTGSADLDANQFNDFHATTLLVQWMRFAPIRDNVTATFAVGPVAQFFRSAFRQGAGLGQPSFSEVESRSTTTTYGLDLGLGVEWFFNSRFSLGGQTGLRATTGTLENVQIFRSGTGPTYLKDERNVDSDASNIRVGTARIQLAGYF